jgi:predicted methyltransferase
MRRLGLFSGFAAVLALASTSINDFPATPLPMGDCREVLRTLPDESVHCCVTSPPYFGLRDYGVPARSG